MSFRTVDAKTLQLSVGVEIAQPITAGKGAAALGDVEMVATHSAHTSHIFANGFGCVETMNVGGATVQKVVCETSVETFLRSGNE